MLVARKRQTEDYSSLWATKNRLNKPSPSLSNQSTLIFAIDASD